MANSKLDTSSTECSVPPPLTDEELLTALDGDPATEVQAHLKRCVFCSSRFQRMRMFEDSLQNTLFRDSCPSSDQLADYVMGTLSAADKGKLERHIQQCLFCQEELVTLQTIFVVDVAQEQHTKALEPVWQQFKTVLQSLSDQLVQVLVPQPRIAYGQLKGNHDPRDRVLTYTKEPVSVMLSLEKMIDTLKINGSIVDTEVQDRWSGSLVELVSTAEVPRRYATFADDDEMFTFDAVAPGHFNLSIYGTSGQILRLQDIEITL
jgi:hypothetical protein